MTESEKDTIEDLCRASEEARDAVNVMRGVSMGVLLRTPQPDHNDVSRIINDAWKVFNQQHTKVQNYFDTIIKGMGHDN